MSYEMLKKVRANLRGRTIDVPAQATGNTLKEELGLGEGRMLVVRPSGSNTVQRVPDHESIAVHDGDEFDDVPVARWG